MTSNDTLKYLGYLMMLGGGAERFIQDRCKAMTLDDRSTPPLPLTKPYQSVPNHTKPYLMQQPKEGLILEKQFCWFGQNRGMGGWRGHLTENKTMV